MDENLLVGAERLAEAAISEGIAKCRQKEQAPSQFDGTCECGEEIPEKRVALGYFRCLGCQMLIEARGKRKG